MDGDDDDAARFKLDPEESNKNDRKHESTVLVQKTLKNRVNLEFQKNLFPLI